MSVITVLGGTGFLGCRITRKLLERGITVRVTSRHPDRRETLWDGPGELIPFEADVRDREKIDAAIEGAAGVVNAVSLYVEGDDASFRDIHVDCAREVAVVAQRRGVSRLVHMSGIGADKSSSSTYIRCRAEGEEAVVAAFPDATILRPSVMFGPDDAFLNTLVTIVTSMPVIPLFGMGQGKLQPVFVDDVAEAAAQVLTMPGVPKPCYELGGPEVLSYRQVLEEVFKAVQKHRLLLPVPFIVWDILAIAGSVLRNPPITRSQVALLKCDNVASPKKPGFPDLGLRTTSIRSVLDEQFRLKSG